MTCATCERFEPYDHPAYPYDGVCYANPPVVVVYDGERRQLRPTVCKDERACGQWTPAKKETV